MEYDLKDTDIIASCTDGADVTVKYGKLSTVEHQLCLAHGIQLTICKEIYEEEAVFNQDETEDSSEDMEEDDPSHLWSE